MPKTLKDHLRNEIVEHSGMFIADIEASPEEMLGRSPGGVARCPFDFVYEVAFVNIRITVRLQGEDPGPWSPIPWTKAPAKFASKERAIAYLKDSVAGLLAAWDQLPEHDLEKKIPTASGETTPLELGSLAGAHAMYHDAQLNYIQTLSGDADIHWQF
jgi:hypothetical protein